MKIKGMSLADGSLFENIRVDYDMEKLNEILAGRGFIELVDGKKKLVVNSEFIVSIEF